MAFLRIGIHNFILLHHFLFQYEMIKKSKKSNLLFSLQLVAFYFMFYFFPYTGQQPFGGPGGAGMPGGPGAPGGPGGPGSPIGPRCPI